MLITQIYNVTNISYTDKNNNITDIDHPSIGSSIDVEIQIYEEDENNYGVIEDSIKIELDEYLESNGVYDYQVYQFSYTLIDQYD